MHNTYFPMQLRTFLVFKYNSCIRFIKSAKMLPANLAQSGPENTGKDGQNGRIPPQAAIRLKVLTFAADQDKKIRFAS